MHTSHMVRTACSPKINAEPKHEPKPTPLLRGKSKPKSVKPERDFLLLQPKTKPKFKLRGYI